MHASANWVSWQGTTDLLTALIDCSTRVSRSSFCDLGGREQQAFGRAWLTLGYVTAQPPRFVTEFAFIC